MRFVRWAGPWGAVSARWIAAVSLLISLIAGTGWLLTKDSATKGADIATVLSLAVAVVTLGVTVLFGVLAYRQAHRPLVPPPARSAEPRRVPQLSEFNDWAALGVHRPITRLANGEDLTAEVRHGVLPSYVLREKDLTDLRPALAAMAGPSRPAEVQLVLVTGESAAGKTRAAAEAMRSELGPWQLLVPHGLRDLTELLDAHLDLRRTVVWLDEVQQLLETGEGPEQLQRLLALGEGPTVVLATLRTDVEERMRGTPAWQLLDRRAVRVPLRRRPVGDELTRARSLDDPWIAEALERIGDRYGIAEYLAAGPQLVRHLDRARDDYPLGAAIVLAAIDCYRAGYSTQITVRGPEGRLLCDRGLIPESILYEMHRLYLEPQRTGCSRKSFRKALKWARKPVSGASPLLEYTHGWGDQAFDYLLSDAARPGAEPIKPAVWPCLLRNATPAALRTIALSAHHHGLQHVVEECLRRIHPMRAAVLLRQFGDTEELSRRADGGDDLAARELAELLVERGDLDGLRCRVDGAGDGWAAEKLAELLAKRGKFDELRQRADDGDALASHELAKWHSERGEIDEVRRLADAGDHDAASLLDELLVERGELDELRQRADDGDGWAAVELANWHSERGEIDQVRGLADAGHPVTKTLAWMLASRGDLDELARRGHAGDAEAAWRLATSLASWGKFDELRRLADIGTASISRTSSFACLHLAGSLAQHGEIDELRHRADAGDRHAARWLAELLLERGELNELRHRADTGDSAAAQTFASHLSACGEEDELRRRADTGDKHAAEELAELLTARGGGDELQRRADSGDKRAADGPIPMPRAPTQMADGAETDFGNG